MKYTVKVNNLPTTVKEYIVACAVDGDLWFYASFDDEELAHINAIGVNGIVIYKEEL